MITADHDAVILSSESLTARAEQDAKRYLRKFNDLGEKVSSVALNAAKSLAGKMQC